MMNDFLKTRPGAPEGFFAAEAAGLRWLAEPSAVPVVEVLETGAEFLRLARVEPAPPSAAGAQEFGRGLARLHEAGAPGFGWAPAETAWFGPLDDPFPVPTTSHDDHATFLATACLLSSCGPGLRFWVDEPTKRVVRRPVGDDRALAACSTSLVRKASAGSPAGRRGDHLPLPVRDRLARRAQRFRSLAD